MTNFSRFALRLRRRLLRLYEAALVAAVLAMAFAAFSPAATARSETSVPQPHCGKAQSSAAAMVR